MENEGVDSGNVVSEQVVIPDPVPEPAPVADEQKTKPPEGEDPPVETTEQVEAKKQSRFQRRLDAQKSARVAAETETKLLREQIAKLEAQSKPNQAPVEPQRDQFESLEDYLKAVAKHESAQLVQQEIKKDREERQAQENKGKVSASEAKIAQQWQERETAFIAMTPDYSEVVQAYISEDVNALSDMARRSILESDVGPQLLVHLAKNPDDAERIADLSPARQVAELGKLELKMPAVQRKTSAAPAPIKPVNGGRSASGGLSDNDSQAEYEAKRKTQGARWAR